MTSSITYPPGQVSLLGQRMLAANRMPHITYVGYEGTKFYLAGPLAPVAGAQSGLVLQSLKGFASPFQHLDVQGARQDGTTWLDSVYDPGEIDMVLELSGVTTADTRAVMRAWLGANSPKKLGRVTCFSPENGEWWADVRQLKEWNDPITQSGASQQDRQKLTWAWRNDNAFWESFDSVSSFVLGNATAIETFTHSAQAFLDPAIWTVYYKGPGTGNLGYDGAGSTQWYTNGYQANEAVCRKIGTGATSATDSQIISLEFKAPPGFDLGGGVYMDIWGRMDASGGTNGIRARIGGGGLINTVVLSSFVGGVEKVLHTKILYEKPHWNEVWTLVCGTSEGVRHYKVMRGKKPRSMWLNVLRTGYSQFPVLDYEENGTGSHVGSSYRGWGWGCAAGGAVAWLTQEPPPGIKEWAAGDNIVLTQSGFLNLTNLGDQDAWPRYVCYGPGTFTFSDGDSPSSNTVTFGPLLEGQIALITTEPRLRSVVDLSPTLPGQSLNLFQKFLEEALSLASNGNLPPLLEKFESQFGILPPQGPMYSLLNGRFTQPIAPKNAGRPPELSQIATSITGGTGASMVVASITPRRLWPL